MPILLYIWWCSVFLGAMTTVAQSPFTTCTDYREHIAQHGAPDETMRQCRWTE